MTVDGDPDGENGVSGFSLGFHLRRVANGWGDEVDLSARFGASRLAGRA